MSEEEFKNFTLSIINASIESNSNIDKEFKKHCIKYITNLQQRVEQLEKENKELNNIINELEKWIKENDLGKYRTENVVDTDELLDKLKELKEE